MNIARKFLAGTARRLELPADVLAGLPRMELVGTEEFSVEPHGGLLEYGTERISVATTLGTVQVLGKELTIRNMNRERLTVTGLLSEIRLPEEAHD